jgi:hypothetical protein
MRVAAAGGAGAATGTVEAFWFAGVAAAVSGKDTEAAGLDAGDSIAAAAVGCAPVSTRFSLSCDGAFAVFFSMAASLKAECATAIRTFTSAAPTIIPTADFKSAVETSSPAESDAKNVAPNPVKAPRASRNLSVFSFALTLC